MVRLIITLLMLVSFSAFAKTITLEKANTVTFMDEVSAESVAIVSNELMEKCNAKKGSDIYLVLYSPGGSVSDGKLFIDFARALPCNIHPISLFAASMAYQIFESLGTRYVIGSSVLMSHRARLGGLAGQIPGELYSKLKFYQDMVDEVDVATAKRIGISFEQYRAEIYDELWMTATVALKKNHADEMINVICGKSLQGTYKQDFVTMFGPLRVTFSKCPIILGPLDMERIPGTTDEEKAKEEVKNFFNPNKVKVKYDI